MGELAPDSVLVQSGFITTDEQVALKAKGAVGDILSRYVDASGDIVDPQLDARTIGLETTLLRRAGILDRRGGRCE
jgi:deoxyribonucleoside regulator